MNFRSRSHRDEPEINFIPLIDVLLVILIFLMVTTTYSKFSELRITLPSADATAPEQRPTEIIVGVTADGAYTVNRNALQSREVPGLTEALGNAAQASGQDVTIIVSADAQAPHQAIINVMEAARLAGLGRLAFAAQTRSTP